MKFKNVMKNTIKNLFHLGILNIYYHHFQVKENQRIKNEILKNV